MPHIPFSGRSARKALTMVAAGFTIAAHAGGEATTREGATPGDGVHRGVFRGWVTYQIACGSCHGPDAIGIGLAPDLRQRLQTLPAAEFVRIVNARYRVTLGLTESVFSDKQRESVLGEVGPRAPAPGGAPVMPSWQSDAAIRERVLDLHAYLRARSEGVQGPGRPGDEAP